MNEAAPTKRGPGRPPKPKVEPKSEPKMEAKTRPKMRANPNWADIDPNAEASVDRFKLPPEFLEKNKDYSFQWNTSEVFGQPDPQHRGRFENIGGWTPVHQDDFDGDLDGLFMKKGDPNEINVGGLVLMARPIEMTEKARRLERRTANEQVQIKEQALRGGDLPVSLDSRHPSAVNSNRIVKSFERIDVPEK